MALADRRRAILDVAVPLLVERGASVTTAQMAKAANIAEGTIFRAFPDKSALIFEALKSAMDAAPVAIAIRTIDRSTSMRRQLAEAATRLRDYFNRMTAIGESLRSVSSPGATHQRDVGKLIKESSAIITAVLVELFESHQGKLRVPPSTAVAAFRGLVFASTHPLLPPRERLTSDEVVGILISGIAKNAN